MTLRVLLDLVKVSSKNFTLTTDAFVVVDIGSDVASRETEGDWVVVAVVWSPSSLLIRLHSFKDIVVST